MKLITALCLAMWLTPAGGKDPAISTVNQIMTFSYPMESSGIMYLSPTTPLLQTREGAVRVARGSIAIDIDVLVDPMPPAESLGGNFENYVVWLISPEGEVRKAGDLVLNGNTGMLHTTTNWGAFGIFVTAEPDSCGTCPGTVVLASEACASGFPSERLATIDCGNGSIPCSIRRMSLPGETR
jgi:hypothetical protein